MSQDQDKVFIQGDDDVVVPMDQVEFGISMDEKPVKDSSIVAPDNSHLHLMVGDYSALGNSNKVQTSSKKGKKRGRSESLSNEAPKRRSSLRSEKIENVLFQIQKLLQSCNQQQRLEAIEKLCPLLDADNKIKLSIHWLGKAMNDLISKSPPDKRNTENKRESRKRFKVASDCLAACYDNENLPDCLERIFNQLRKNPDYPLQYFSRSKEQLHKLQDAYTRLAAEIFIRWRLTRTQYRTARSLLLGNGRLPSNNNSAKMRINQNDVNSLVTQTMGVEIWPSLDALIKTANKIKQDIELDPINVRQRGADGRFVWKKENARKPSTPRCNPNRNTESLATSSKMKDSKSTTSLVGKGEEVQSFQWLEKEPQEQGINQVHPFIYQDRYLSALNESEQSQQANEHSEQQEMQQQFLQQSEQEDQGILFEMV